MYGKPKTLLYLAVIGCLVFLFVLAPVPAMAADKTTWMKYNNVAETNSDTTSTDGRIPLGIGVKGDAGHVRNPAVIKDGSTNRMWYTAGAGASGWSIYYATSVDGLTWTKYDNSFPPDTSDTTNWGNGRIPLGSPSKGDEKHVRNPCVIKDDSTYKMWYTGRDSGNTSRIYYATSTDGLTWTKYSNSVPDASNTTGTYGRIPIGTSGGDTAHVAYPAVIKDGSTYKMWYSGSDGTNYRIYHATSSNGLTWIKYSNSVSDASNTTGTYGRIPLGTSGGDTDGVFCPAVIKKGSTYKMWYSGTDGTYNRIYYAFSTDGLTWKKYDNSIHDPSDTISTNGRVPLGIIGGSGGDTNSVFGACVIEDGYFYKMWYCGYGGVGNRWRIYHATLDALPEGLIFYGH